MLRRDRGDTLIEVMFAFSILSLMVVAAMAIMNQGSAASQRSLEITLVRQQIDAQATTLRFLHDSYVSHYRPNATFAANTPAGQWQLMANAITTDPATDLTACQWPRRAGSFILDPVNAKYEPLSSGKIQQSQSFAQLRYDAAGTTLNAAEGIWIEGVRSVDPTDVDQNNTRYIDFHIYACWDSPGQGPPVTIGTIVRLYEPRN